MSALTCGAESILRRGGPVQVPLQPCCVAALLRAARTAAPTTPALTTVVPCPLRADLRALSSAPIREGVA